VSKCAKCGASVDPEEIRELGDESLCEDCYLERMAKPVTCDPWAVYSAKRTGGQAPQLTDGQERILNLLKEKGPLEGPEICRQLGINEEQFQNSFATLRHMELARGFKTGDKVLFTVW
jgi:DNA-directed RNA polymerase subunit RPC12/RpoP